MDASAATIVTRGQLGDRVADRVTAFAGSWRFLGLHAVWWLAWWWLHLDLNTLTMILSLEAIILTALVLMSQGRAADRDRAAAEMERAEVSEIDQIDQESIEILREMRRYFAARPEPPLTFPD